MTRYTWPDDNLRLAECRLCLIEIIAFAISAFAFAFGFGFVTAWAFWG